MLHFLEVNKLKITSCTVSTWTHRTSSLPCLHPGSPGQWAANTIQWQREQLRLCVQLDHLWVLSTFYSEKFHICSRVVKTAERIPISEPCFLWCEHSCNHAVSIKTKKLTFIQHYSLHYRLYSDFLSFSINVRFLCQCKTHTACSHLASLISSNRWQFLRLSLLFTTLALLKDTGQVSCSMSLNIGVSAVS